MRLIQKPDWDPNNPYHYHVNGKKVVITPEDWEKYKDDPTFREVRAAVEAEQAAYPEPEYDEIENPSWRQAYQRLVNGINLKGRSNYNQPLPQGYTRDEKGVAMDAQGNYYIPVETATNAPYFVNQERGTMGHIVPVRYEQQQMPDRTIRQLRQPLPVNRVMNVGEEREKAINDYINNGSISKQVTKHYPSKGYYKDTYYPYIAIVDASNKAYTVHTISNTKSTGLVRLPDKELEQIPQDKNNPNVLITYPKNRDYTKPVQFIVPFETDNLNYSDFLDLIHSGGFSPTIEWVRDNGNSTKGLTWDKGYPVHREIVVTTPAYDKMSIQQVKPSRQEAEKNAVIKVGDLEKVGTFAEGGKLISKYQLGGLLYNGTYGVNREYDLNNSKNLAKQMLNSMSKQDIKNLQIRLIEEKYYKIPEFVNKNNSKKVKELQRQSNKLILR